MTDGDADDVEIISSEDEKIKLIGEIFSNDTSRRILRLISNDKEMTANEIARKNDMSLTLVTHHLRRMQTAGMVKVTKTEKSVKGQDMKYYLATKQSFLIVPPEKTVRTIFNSIKKFSKFAAIGMAGLVSWMILRPNGGNFQTMPTQESDSDAFTGAERSATDEYRDWSSGEVPRPEVRLEDQSADTEPVPEPAPSHSGVQEFEIQTDSDVANTGSVTLDKTVYPQPYDFTGAESAEPFIFSIIIPVVVIVVGLIIERVLTRWLRNRSK